MAFPEFASSAHTTDFDGVLSREFAFGHFHQHGAKWIILQARDEEWRVVGGENRVRPSHEPREVQEEYSLHLLSWRSWGRTRRRESDNNDS